MISFYIRAAIIVAIIAALGYAVYDYTSTKTALVTAQHQIDLQNQALSDLKSASDAKIAAAQKALELARKQTVIKTEAARVIYETLPAVPDDSCSSALILGNTK